MGHEASNGAKSPYATDGEGRIVLVLQGGGALGAYQAGVYQALHEAGIEPDWMIGTSIGAINAALIAGNEPENRVPALREFWRRMAHKSIWHEWSAWPRFAQSASYLTTITVGLPGFFVPNPRFPRAARASRRRPRWLLFNGAAGADSWRAARHLARRAQQAAADGGRRARAH